MVKRVRQRHRSILVDTVGMDGGYAAGADLDRWENEEAFIPQVPIPEQLAEQGRPQPSTIGQGGRRARADVSVGVPDQPPQHDHGAPSGQYPRRLVGQVAQIDGGHARHPSGRW